MLEVKHLVVFTGAGISMESGLPDSRGPDGIWTRQARGLPQNPIASDIIKQTDEAP